MTFKSGVEVSSVVGFSLFSFFSVSFEFIKVGVFEVADELVVFLVLEVVVVLVGVLHGFNLFVEELKLVGVFESCLFS
jgi:hypothetical protein